MNKSYVLNITVVIINICQTKNILPVFWLVYKYIGAENIWKIASEIVPILDAVVNWSALNLSVKKRYFENYFVFAFGLIVVVVITVFNRRVCHFFVWFSLWLKKTVL